MMASAQYPGKLSCSSTWLLIPFNCSSDKIFTLYEELQTSDAPPHLVNQYEEVISALVSDVKKMETESKKLEEKMAK